MTSSLDLRASKDNANILLGIQLILTEQSLFIATLQDIHRYDLYANAKKNCKNESQLSL
jgi:hypothetical protein